MSKTITITHNSGFFSCCSVRLHDIVNFINENKCLPDCVDSSNSYLWYKLPDEGDITFDYFENYVDLSYLEFIHSLIIKEIKTLLKGQNVLHLSHQDILDLDPCINFSQVFRKHAGLMNHYDDQGNFIVYSQIAGFV